MAPKKKPASKRTSLSPRSGSSDGSAAVTRIQAVQSIEEVKAKETELTNEKKKLTEEKAGLTKEKADLTKEKADLTKKEADLLDLVGRLNPLSAVKSELLRAGVAVYSNDTITTVESRIATKLATNQQRSTELARQFDVVGQLLIKNAEQLARLTAVSQPQTADLEQLRQKVSELSVQLVVREGDDATKKFDAVGKQFTNIEYFKREVKALKKLADSGFENVPRLKAHDEKGLRLVTSPRGRHFTVDRWLTMKHVKQLMAVLKKLHELGFVHCDVRPSNFFATEEGEAFLNDWSSSSIADENPDLVLPDNFRIPGRPLKDPASQVDDLYSFALSCFMVQNATKVTGDFLLSDKLTPMWHELLEKIAAGNMKHDELLAGLEQLLPRAEMQ
ncbi:hypothetical protein DIPPA_01605 [Diplonema papillatum]|nr:hypothetical protein DIPPA_01605 [Diplonema papillatum]